MLCVALSLAVAWYAVAWRWQASKSERGCSGPQSASCTDRRLQACTVVRWRRTLPTYFTNMPRGCIYIVFMELILEDVLEISGWVPPGEPASSPPQTPPSPLGAPSPLLLPPPLSLSATTPPQLPSGTASPSSSHTASPAGSCAAFLSYSGSRTASSTVSPLLLSPPMLMLLPPINPPHMPPTQVPPTPPPAPPHRPRRRHRRRCHRRCHSCRRRRRRAAAAAI